MDSLAQIVCLRPSGRDPRTVVEMGPRDEILARFEEVKGAQWPGKSVRPLLEVWGSSGQRIAPVKEVEAQASPDKTTKKK